MTSVSGMASKCPECGARLGRGAPVGKAFACPACGNPVLLEPVVLEEARAGPSRSSAAARREAPPARAPVARPAPSRAALLGVATFVVLGAAYVGVYELLVAGAKRERDAIVRHHGEAVLTAPPPGEPPADADPAGLAAHGAARERFDLRVRHEALSRRIGTFFAALLGAFALQTILCVTMVVRAVAGRRRTAGRPKPS